MAAVLKPFAFAADGYTVELLNVGDDREFGALTDGLVEAGFVSADGISPAETPAETPVEGEQGAEDQDPESKKRGK